MDKLKPREKVLLIVLFAALILYVYVKFLFTPLQNDLKDKSISVNEKITENNILDNMKLQNKKLKKEMGMLSTDYEASKKLLPESERNPEICYRINDMASSAKVIINSVNVGAITESKNSPVKDNKGEANGGKEKQKEENDKTKKTAGNNKLSLTMAPVSINTSGDYASLIKFIHNLENNERQCQITSVVLNGSDDKLQANISLEYYYVNKTNIDEIFDFNKGTYGKDSLFK